MWVINNAKLSEITTLCMCWKEQTIWLEAKRNHRAQWEQRLIRWCHSEKKWQTDRIDHYITTSILWIQSFSFFLLYIIHFGGNLFLVNQFQLLKSTLIYICFWFQGPKLPTLKTFSNNIILFNLRFTLQGLMILIFQRQRKTFCFKVLYFIAKHS